MDSHSYRTVVSWKTTKFRGLCSRCLSAVDRINQIKSYNKATRVDLQMVIMLEGVTDLLAKAITSGDSTRLYHQVELGLHQF